MLKVDLHTHSADDPADRISYSTFELIDRAAELGFDAIAVTLHDRQLDPVPFCAYAASRGIVLIPGIERTIQGRHVLMLNFSRAAEHVETFDDLARLKASERGLIIAPHPFFPAGSALRGLLSKHAHLFDAVEWNAMFTPHVNFNLIGERWARRHGKPMVGNGDVHRLEQLGTTYSLVDAEPNADAICGAIAAGRVQVVATPHTFLNAAWLMTKLVASTFLPRTRSTNDPNDPNDPNARYRLGGLNPSLTTLLHNILTSRVYDVARETPLDRAPGLSRRLGNTVLLKREDLQPVFSFKLRGAYNKIAHLTAAQRGCGIITASAGNHAQGVAYSARKLGVRAVIVMPQTTPTIKVDAVRAMGADVVLSGDTYGDAKAHCDTLVGQTGMTFIHPYDDPLVIAGQGTIGAEILRHSQDHLSAVFVPIGGGGLIAGIAGYIKALRPDIKVVGVEPFEADAMYRSLKEGARVHLDHVGLFADGVAVRDVGELTFAVARETVDEVVRVTNDEVCAAIKDIFDDTRSIMEPAGALAAAGLKTWVEREGATDKMLVAVLSGANMNFDRLRFVAERAELGEAREALIAVTIPERKGAFREFCGAIGRRVVTEFNYRLSGRQQAHIFVGFATQSRQDADALIAQLRQTGYETVDLTDNEMAKLHVRHMVGGHAPEVQHERLCRFEFPERPGALANFLDALAGRWNISLFHYRNHGSDFGRVLAGLEVEDRDLPAFRSFLEGLGYEYTIESDNPAYRFFLG